MDFLVGTTHHGKAVIAAVHSDRRRSKYWNPLKRYGGRMFKVAMFLTIVASVAISGATIASAFLIN
jgi:hypothetical protein